MRHVFTLRVCVSAWRLKDKRPGETNSLVKLGLRRRRRRLIRKVQKILRQASSRHIVPTPTWLRQRSSFDGTESEKKRQVKPEGDGDFPTMHRGRWCDISGQSQTVWCVKRPTRPPSESVHTAACSSRLEKRAPAASAGRRCEFYIQSVSLGRISQSWMT